MGRPHRARLQPHPPRGRRHGAGAILRRRCALGGPRRRAAAVRLLRDAAALPGAHLARRVLALAGHRRGAALLPKLVRDLHLLRVVLLRLQPLQSLGLGRLDLHLRPLHGRHLRQHGLRLRLRLFDGGLRRLQLRLGRGVLLLELLPPLPPLGLLRLGLLAGLLRLGQRLLSVPQLFDLVKKNLRRRVHLPPRVLDPSLRGGQRGLRAAQQPDVLGAARGHLEPSLLGFPRHVPRGGHLLEQRPDGGLGHLHLAQGGRAPRRLLEVLHKRQGGLEEQRHGARGALPRPLRLAVRPLLRRLQLPPGALPLAVGDDLAVLGGLAAAGAHGQELVLDVLDLGLADGRGVQGGPDALERLLREGEGPEGDVHGAAQPNAFRTTLHIPRLLEQLLHLPGRLRQRVFCGTGHRACLLGGLRKGLRRLVRTPVRGLRLDEGLLGVRLRTSCLRQLRLRRAFRRARLPQSSGALLDDVLGSGTRRREVRDRLRGLDDALLRSIPLLLDDLVRLRDLLRPLRGRVHLLLRLRDPLLDAVRKSLLLVGLGTCEGCEVACACGEPLAKPTVGGCAILVGRLPHRILGGRPAAVEQGPRFSMGGVRPLEERANLLGREEVRLLIVLERGLR
mmetsp:Transcript_18018/g.51314  ORF Transcript_18018/g.51314 Transcript_18018/m.51314 type:complete len:619 (+) Transcript_18018:216-2072(+)